MIEDQNDGPRSIKEIIHDVGRQLIVSLIILVIGFFALNWSAYFKIAKSEFTKITGDSEEISTPLITENKTSTDNLKTSSSAQIQKKQIPEINLEIAPTDNRLIIPRIDQNIPIVRVSSENLIKRNWNGLERDMQKALQDGVVHYPGTALPGQEGNVVVTGHSSYFPWDPGRFKDVFALLHDVVVGDQIVVFYEQKKYIYEISSIKVVLPKDVDVLKPTANNQLTLITCTPVGTNLKRLVVTAIPVIDESIASSQKVPR